MLEDKIHLFSSFQTKSIRLNRIVLLLSLWSFILLLLLATLLLYLSRNNMILSIFIIVILLVSFYHIFMNFIP